MTAAELQEQLTKSYDRDKWLSLIRDVLPSAQPYASPQAVPVGDIKAKAIWQLGEIQLADGRRVALLEMEVEPGTDLARNRAGLRQLAARFIDLARFHSVLTTYHAGESSTTEGAGRWRLTFALREATLDGEGQIAVRETAPKRFTYLLGEGEPCRTPAERLFGLAALGRTAETKHLEEAFSIEALNREFFRKFKDLFDVLTAELRDHFPKWKKPDQPGQRDPAAEEAQTLLNRLLFLSFVQRKGWLHRDQKYLSRHFHEHHAKRKGESYYSEFLSHVFEIVSTEWAARDKAISHLPEHNPRTHDLPFLNGGLFQDDDPNDDDTRRRRGLAISNTTFARLFGELFDAYNFTIREDSPLDIEVAVDPEMLGKIFEELILAEELGIAGKSRRHDTGSHYTPRPIVHFLCQEALAAWLERRPPFAGKSDGAVRIRNLLALDASEGVDEETRASLRELLDKEEAGVLLRQLDDLRACDPAVGSGAFPMGLLYELLNLAHLATTCARGKDPADADLAWAYDLRKNFILSALYGVDIQPVPVEICKLRLWLSLLVDHELRVRPLDCTRREFQSALKTLEPLPNLDFKIRRANSLEDTIHGQRVAMQRLSGDSRSRLPLSALTSAKRAYFTADSQRKKRELRLSIADAYSELAQIELGWQKVERGLAFDDGSSSAATASRLDAILREIGRFREQMKGARRKLTASEQDRLLEEIADFFDAPGAPTFVWRLDFAETFTPPAQVSSGEELAINEKSQAIPDVKAVWGFDIIIGNPPFVRMEKFKAMKENLRERFADVHSERADLYCYFFQLGFGLLQPAGALGFVSSNKFLRSGYGAPLRTYLARRTTMRRVVDFRDLPVFEATSYPCVLVASNGEPPQGHSFQTLTVSREEDLPRFADLAFTQIEQKTVAGDPWQLETDDTRALIGEMETSSKSLTEVVRGNIYRGIVTGLNKAFIVSRAERDLAVRSDSNAARFFKPFALGRDIRRWHLEATDQFIIYTPHGVSGDGLSVIKKILSEYRPQLESRSTKQAWYELQQPQERFTGMMEAPKIIYPDIAESLRFTYDEGGHYLGNTAYFIASDQTWLLGVLNSAAVEYFYLKLSAQLRGGYVRGFTQFIEKIPIPNATDAQRKAIQQLVEYILFLHRKPSLTGAEPTNPRDPLAAQYFERWVNALVYQLFFPDKIASAQLDFFRLHAETSLSALDAMPQAKRLVTIREFFERLSEPTHPLRGALFALDSVPVVKAVEGRA